MYELRELPKPGSRLLLPIIMSILFHCCISALFLIYVREMISVPLPERIISVEIHTLEPPVEMTKPVSVTPRSALQHILRTKPEKVEKPKPLVQAPVQKPAPLRRPDTAPLPSAPGTAESSPITPPARAGNGSTAKEAIPSPGIAIQEPRPGSGMPVPGPAPIVEIRADSAYLAALRALIEKQKDYPSTARRGRMEGTAIIGCVMTRNGRLREARIIRSSGHDILDNAALRTVRSAGKFPPVPAEIRGDSFRFSCPITYRLVQ